MARQFVLPDEFEVTQAKKSFLPTIILILQPLTIYVYAHFAFKVPRQYIGASVSHHLLLQPHYFWSAENLP